MKKFKQNYLSVIIAVILLSSCGGLNKMIDNSSTVGYNVQPSPLETHAGEVQVTIKTTFPEKYFNKKAIVVATPVIKYGEGQAEYESTTLQGEKVEANNTMISSAGGSYEYSGKVAYDPGMLKSELMMEMSARIGDKEPVEIPGIKIADGVIATSTLVNKKGKAIAMGDKFQRVIPETYEADIHYVINQSDVRPAELRAEDITNLQKKLAEASKAENKEVKGAKVSAYASPDGAYDLNEKLSGNRGKSAERYLNRTMKDAKIKDIDKKELISMMSTAEDWEGFKKLMEESSIQDKELILRVLSMHSDPAVREKEIKNISEAFEVIKVDVLPKLRRSMIGVNVEVIGYSDEELIELVKTNPDTLNLEEILYAATLTDDNNKKLMVYQIAAKNFPQCYRAKNNIGYIQVELGNLAEAKAAFEEAKALNENDIINNNLGVISLAEGDITSAENFFTSAMSAGEVVNYNLGTVKIIQGQYKDAVNYFGNKPSYNAALAQLLNGDAAAAINTLNELDSEKAMVNYLKAVAGARAGREEVVLNSLRASVEKDAGLKEYAKKDLEFAKYASTQGFTSIVE